MDEVKELKLKLVKEELKVEILKTISTFSSKFEPDVSLKDKDILNVLSSIITRKTE
jgi:hypothetical protein